MERLLAERKGWEVVKMLELNAVVTHRDEIAPGLLIMRIAPVGWELPAFKAGQFAVVGLPPDAARHPFSDSEDEPEGDGRMIRRSYSIASSSRQGEYLELYLNMVRSGGLTPRLFALQEGDRVWLAPRIAGFFTLDQLPPAVSLIMVATGTGVTPYMSMLRSHLESEPERPFAVIHGARHSWDLGYSAELLTLQRLFANLLYVPTVSRPDEEPLDWGGEKGRVQDVWRSRIIETRWGVPLSPADTHVLLCGNPTMVEDMVELLGSEGYREQTAKEPGEIHAERYW